MSSKHSNPDEWYISYDTYYLIDAFNNQKINFNDGLNFLQVIHKTQIFSTQEEIDGVISVYK